MSATTTKERPILFSSEMVRAILEGRKTQTRRIVQPIENACEYTHVDRLEDGWRLSAQHGKGLTSWDIGSRYGWPGDRLWVRETFDIVDDPAAWHRDDLFLDESDKQWKESIKRGPNGERWVVDYAADTNSRVMDKIGKRKWRPSIHMPRWASRIQLNVTNVRVERVQDIDPWDCVEEGVDCEVDHAAPKFIELWDKINGKRLGCSWADNPWVWVVEFNRVEH